MGIRLVTLILAAAALSSAHKWTAILQPSGDSILTGTAVVEEVSADSLAAEIQLSGAKPGSEIAWHIHLGTCADKGMILGAEGAYPLLKVGTDGRATGGVTVAGSLPEQGEYSISVHKSSGGMNSIACGSLKSTGGAAPDSGPTPKQ